MCAMIGWSKRLQWMALTNPVLPLLGIEIATVYYDVTASDEAINGCPLASSPVSKLILANDLKT